MNDQFELLKEHYIAELNTRARLFRHLATGAELLSLENNDENKVFGITFRTPPPNSTGLPHIMEHAVLGGSKKYPVREPFVELLKGSLATFVNAMTFADMTTYPVASQNLNDFYNLIDVYMDGVLHPSIPEHTFQQEGWHYELAKVDGTIEYKGIVFNEMKGAYSSPESLISTYSTISLFPNHPYGYDSGGDPREIPNLSYEEFRSFFEVYYHPSNARIYFYGDDDPEQRLQYMAKYLEGYKAKQVNSMVPLITSFGQPQWLKFPYDPGESDEVKGSKAMVTTNWVLTEGSDSLNALLIGMLTHILIGTPASPLRKALIDSGLGEDLVGSGLDTYLRQQCFSTGLKGIDQNQARDVEQLILHTLEKLTHEGIDPATVEASVNTIEFGLRENNTGRFPRGLLLMLRSLTSWLYGGDPILRLSFEGPLSEIKDRLGKGERYFEGMIQKYFLDNQHRTTVLLYPESGYNQRLETEEKERLIDAQRQMTSSDLQSIIDNAAQLKQRQETPDSTEALATIPVLSLSDLDRKNKILPIEIQRLADCELLYHDLFTNGIFYFDLGFNLRFLPQDLLPYVSLFGKSLLEIGTEADDFVKISQRIGRSTGGIYPTTHLSSVKNSAEGTYWLFLRGKATLDHCNDLLTILRDILLTVKLDNKERFHQMVLEEKAELESRLIPRGHVIVNTRLRAHLDQVGWVAETIGGIEYLNFLRKLDKAIKDDWEGVLGKLESIRRIVINRKTMLVNVTLDHAGFKEVQPQIESFLQTFPAKPAVKAEWVSPQFPKHEGLTIPAQVNYVGKGGNLYNLGYNYHASLMVISNYLQTTWLWERVRVQGGAYGAGMGFDHLSGILTYWSYRDPNLLKTLENYDGTAQFLSNLNIDQAELTKSIIGTIGEMDTYLLPDAKGFTAMTRYLGGITEQERQIRREQVLNTKLDDFKAFGEALKKLNDTGSVVVMGSNEAMQYVNHERGEWLELKRVM